jgi:DNA-binding MarR family transcriptional regulator
MLHAALELKAAVETALFEATDLLLADHEALLHLGAAEGALRMSDIADRLVLSRGGTTKVIDRLEDRGLAERIPDPGDRRATLVRITPAGTEALAAARPVVDEVLWERWGRHLSGDEARTVLDLVDRAMRASRRDE